MVVKYNYLTNGADIYRRSFEIIRAEADFSNMPPAIARVAARMVHAAADPQITADIRWSENIVSSVRAALDAGAPIFCDTQMTASGITRSRLPHNNEIICELGNPAVTELASKIGNTKTASAVELWLPRLDGAIVAIGNAPTALFHLLEVLHTTDIRP
ncbi:MAG: precorrin-8X methylmutase, partial [Propionibacterium sp.]